MNWDKAKNIIIIALICINIVLLIVSNYGSDKYILSSDKEKAIISLLNKNGIKVITELPKKFEPSPYLLMDKSKYNAEELKSIFFEEGEDVKRSVEFEATIFKTDKKILTINESSIDYRNMGVEKSVDKFEASEAKKEAEKIIKALMKNKSYELQEIKFTNGRYYLRYYEIYLKNKIYSNYIDFVINKNGIEIMQLIKYDIEGFYGTNREICSADEALFSFLQGIKSEDAETEILIDGIELGYCFEEAASQSRAIPCYRISVKDGEVYYINAYTGEIIIN